MEAAIQICEKLVDVNSRQGRSEGAQIDATGNAHAPGSAEIAFGKVIQRNSSLNQSLKERLLRAGQFPPEVFQHIVACEVFAVVKQSNPFVNARVIEIAVRHGQQSDAFFVYRPAAGAGFPPQPSVVTIPIQPAAAACLVISKSRRPWPTMCKEAGACGWAVNESRAERGLSLWEHKFF
jgi:hypothetical protein